ncbi:MAG TPA: hypothetical protein VF145_14165, partial [Chitinophagaceae bacterium]
MKFKGVIPEGYELVNGRYGKYLRRIAGDRHVNKVLGRNSRYAGAVNTTAATIKDGIAGERKYCYDGTLYNRLRGLLLEGVGLADKWWTRDWLCGFEANIAHELRTVIQFKSSYGFKRNVLQVELGELFLTEITRRKKKLFDAVRLYAVVLFINEEKGEFTRYQSDPAVISLRTKRIGLEVKCVKKP